MQTWHFTERENGISFRQETENIQTAQGRTGQLELGTGRRLGQNWKAQGTRDQKVTRLLRR